MSLAAWAVKYRPIVFSVIVLSMVWGIFAFVSMPRREDPAFTIRVCVVSTRWPGAPTELVEELITDKLEQELVGIEEVKLTRSTTRSGQSTVFVELDDNIDPSDIQNVWDKVRARVDLVEMPSPEVKPIVNDEFGDTAILVLAVHQVPLPSATSIRKEDEYNPRELEEFAETIQDELRLLDNVAKVDLFGVRDEAVYIETDLGNWSQLRLTTGQLEQLARDRNIIEPGGEIDTEAGHFLVKPGGEFDAVDEIEQIASVVRSGADQNSVLLSELGLTADRRYREPANYLCRFGDTDSSVEAVTLGLTMKSGANIIKVCEEAKKRVEELIDIEQRLPADIAVTPVSDQSENVEQKINDVISNVNQAIVIVVVVVFLVVGLRSSLVMAANIPVVVIMSLGVIKLFGVELEQISLAAMIISLGLLVDNAVQVCDQARTNQMAGMAPFPAAIAGANTLAIPMLVGTLTTMAAFVPMLFALDGGPREYIYSLPVTVSTTLALSWFLAMTLCVILAGLFIKVPSKDAAGSPIQWLIRRMTRRQVSSTSEQRGILGWYGILGRLAVEHKWLTGLATLGLIASIMSQSVSSEFFPEAARDQFAIKIILPETATIEQTNKAAKEVEEVIRQISLPADSDEHRLRAMRTLVGGGGSRWHLGWDPEPPTRNFAEILVRTTDGRLTAEYAAEIRQVCEVGDPKRGINPVAGARVIPVQLALGPPADPLLFRVKGTGYADPDQLKEYSRRLKKIVSEQPESWDVSDSWGNSGNQIRVDVDQGRAVLAGVTNAQIAETLNTYFSGKQLTTFREGDHVIPVFFRLKQEQRNSIKGLEEAYVEGDQGKVPLSSIATFHRSFELSKIDRRNRNRIIKVSAQVEPGVTGNDVVNNVLSSKAFKELVDDLEIGYSIETGGSYEESADASMQMLTSFVASFVLIVLCLIAQFNGWAKPIVILTTLPIALAGAMLGLYVTGNSLGFMPQLGILALFGIVLNTAIIFFEFADIVIAEKIRESKSNGPIQGLSVEDFRACLVEAGKQRMLPIFLTTATTVGGLLPLALSGGPLWEGLAWAMIFGLSLATLLTLFIVPAFYAILVETFGVRPLPHLGESD